jgi:outer membrane protein assembly factor BamB
VLDSSEGLDIQPLVYAGSVLLSIVPASVRGGYLGGSRGELLALDVRDGQPRWRFDTVDSDDLWGDPEHNSGGGAWYPPTVDRERGATYWGTGNPGPLGGTPPYGNGESRPGDNAYTSGVLAIGLARGELRWFHQEQKHDLFDWDFQNPPILVRGAELGGGARDRLIGSGKTGTVVGLDAESGALLFRTKVGLHENDELREIPEDGARIAPGVLGGVLTPAAYADGVVYVPVVDYPTSFTRETFMLDEAPATGQVVAIDVHDGEVLWTTPLPAAAIGAATVVNDLVLVPDQDGVVHALSREDGSSVFRYETHGGINAPLTVAGELVLVPVGVSSSEPALLGLVVP